MGISKRELFEDYYHDELPAIFESYADIRLGAADNVKEVGCEGFFAW